MLYVTYFVVLFEISAMKKIAITVQVKPDGPTPRWIEAKVCVYFINTYYSIAVCLTKNEQA